MIVRDLTDPRWIRIKGGLFLLLGLMSAAVLLSDVRSMQDVVLLAVCVWSFCRFYYFAFYVMERYVDSSFRFAGLLALGRHLLRNRSRHENQSRAGQA